MRFPIPPLRVSETDPDEMKILVQKDAAMLAGLSLQFRIQHDPPPPDVRLCIGIISPDVAEITAVPDLDLSAVEQIG
jgi:hypothetical protein